MSLCLVCCMCCYRFPHLDVEVLHLICMYTRFYIYTYAYIYIYMCIHTWTYITLCKYVCIYIYVYIYTCVYIHICIHTHAYIYIYIYICVCVCLLGDLPPLAPRVAAVRAPAKKDTVLNILLRYCLKILLRSY